MWSVNPRFWPLLGETLLLLIQARLLRLRRVPRLRLPPVNGKPGLSADEALALAARVNRLTRLFAGKSRHACWYRGYPLAVMLRRRGLDARLNIGLACLDLGPGLVRGHVWLTLDGAAFNEPVGALGDAARTFPHLLADNGRGVRCWVAAGRGGPRSGTRLRAAERGRTVGDFIFKAGGGT